MARVLSLRAMRSWPSVVALAIALAIVGIAACSGPAAEPAIDSGSPPPPPPPPPPVDAPVAGIDHTVGEGETLWDIARAYDVGVEAIMAANHLRDRDVRRLRRGMVLRIPGATAAVE